jgi:molecular chaperone DnaK
MAPRGVPKIEVTFDIDANGILNVNAKDMATGKDQKITITSSSGLSKEEVERMAKEADAHAAEDKARRAEIESRNQLDGMVYQIEKMLREHGDKISGEERGAVENALGDAKKALEGTDAMYKAQAAPAGGPSPSGDGAAGEQEKKKDEGVIDAEYVDVEDKK